MPRFKYVVINAKGQRIHGEVESRDRVSVMDFLKKEQVTIVSLGEVKGIKSAFFGKAQSIKLSDLVVFSRQLATLVKAGVPLVKGLSIIHAQVENKSLKAIVNSLQINIESGRSLSEALGLYPGVFSEIFINMVKAGEMGGALDAILEKMSGYLEEADKLMRKFKNAMIYPAIVVSMALLITSFIFIKVIPSFKEMFISLDITLPLPTLIVIGISDFIRGFYLYLAGAIIGLAVAFHFYSRSETGRLNLDRIKLKLPIFGNLIIKVTIARFSRTLAVLVKSGISIVHSLEIVARTCGNLVVERALLNTKLKVSHGEKIGESLRASGKEVFAPLVVDMITVGEETGNISAMLDKIADFYEEEANGAISALMSLIEPLLIIFLGGLVALIALAMFLPIMEIIKKLGH